MDNAKYEMKELRIQEFINTIFQSEADFLAPLTLFPGDIGYSGRQADFQDLRTACDMSEKYLQQWMAWCGVAGITQYSLRNNTQVGLFARCGAEIRNTKQEEAQLDWENFGEQVMGDKIVDVPKGETYFNAFGRRYLYQGPSRVMWTLFPTRVFNGGLPEKLDSLVKEIDSVEETDERIHYRNYSLLHADNGIFSQIGFEKISDYDPSKVRFSGEMVMDKDKMLFLPNGDRTSPIDYTDTIFRK